MAARLFRAFSVAVLLLAATPIAVSAQEGPIDAPEGFAAVRDRFEDLTAGEIEAMGYVADPPVCVAEPELGGMGVHAVNGELLQQQFPTAELDADNPPIVLLSADRSRAIGLEWEAKDIGQGETELFGQPVTLQPGHPGLPEPHYMLHAYFRANGQVLFATFDPEVQCAPDTATVDPSAPRSSDSPLPPVLFLVAAAAAFMMLRWWQPHLERRP